MKDRKNTHSKTIIGVVAGVAGAGLLFGAAAAYWTGGGAGNGSVTTASAPAGLTVGQTAAGATLAPGTSVALSGLITNPGATDVKVGSLSAVITGFGNSGVAAADFTITGGPVVLNAVVKNGTPLAWNGMTLTYANSAVNQDNARSTTVAISYTLTPFVENVVPALGTKTVTTVNGVRTVTIRINNVNGTALVPGQQLSFWYTGTTSMAPNGFACAGTTSTYCNVTAPAPVGTGNVNTTLPTVDANGVLYFVGAYTSAVQWQFVNGSTIGTL